ncbi:MAG: hypothetical protein M0P69_19770 [Bacteroidales bacterium]|nr:hypothetical protein [Bacteroidales bacterium]
MAKIPREIWRFCVDQIKYYPLTEIAYADAKADIQACYYDSGMAGPPDPTGVHVHSGQGPQEGKYLAKERALNNPYYRYLLRSVGIMEVAKMGQDEKVLEAIWSEGWRDNVMIAARAKTSPRQVARVKHELVRRLATGWGLW